LAKGAEEEEDLSESRNIFITPSNSGSFSWKIPLAEIAAKSEPPEISDHSPVEWLKVTSMAAFATILG
jgi:hypothetical protein